MKYIFTLLFTLLISFNVIGQIKDVGLPFINNYPRDIYGAGTQNWSITQDSDGVLYFANNDGVLEFDGKNWELHRFPNGVVVRSVAYYNNRLYAGGFDEFGYFSFDERGRHTYHSLSDLLPAEQRTFGEIWKIYNTEDGIVFQSFMKIAIVKDKAVEIIEPISGFGFSYLADGDIYVVDRETGLYILKNEKLQLIHEDADFYRDNEIKFVIPHGFNKVLLGTVNRGIYLFDGVNFSPWEVEVNKRLQRDQIYTGILMPENQIAIGTIQEGVFIIDFSGRIVLHVNRYKGLQNNTVLSLFLDKYENLWMGLDNGIDVLEISSPISLFNYCFNIETSYTSIVHNEMLYIGTNQGLFVKGLNEINNQSLMDEEFELIEGTKGQVWSLRNIRGRLFCGHSLGTFLVEDKTAKRISEIEGGWDFAQIPGEENKVLGGTYNGLVLYNNIDNIDRVESNISKITGFDESSKELYFDRRKLLWITHGYKGLYKLKLNEDFTTVTNYVKYDSTSGLPQLPYSITEIDGEFYIVGNNGLYTYDYNIDSFYIDKGVSQLFEGVSGLSKIVEDYKGDIWYFTWNEGIGVLRLQEDGSYNRISVPFNRIKNQYISSSFENIYVFNSENVFIGSQQGMLHYDIQKQKDFKIPYKTFLGNITIKSRVKDSLLYHKHIQDAEDSIFAESLIPHKFNSISFDFMSPFFEAPNETLYSYKLDGFDDGWSKWSPQTFKEYTNLKEGEYVFNIRAKNVYDHISEVSTFLFTVKPPFYRTKFAYTVYVLILIVISILNINFYRRRLERARLIEQEKHEKEMVAKEQKFQEEVKQSEEEIERLKNEKLTIEMRHKNMELANSTMHIIQKNKFLNKVKDDLHAQINKLTLDSNKYALRQIVKRIDKDIKSDRQWKVFDKYFDEVHEDFTNRIKEKHPDLTPKELRLCSYLRMNISTKEIAPLMNISVRGVEISRYRLRKKLNLDRESNLIDYILGL